MERVFLGKKSVFKTLSFWIDAAIFVSTFFTFLSIPLFSSSTTFSKVVWGLVLLHCLLISIIVLLVDRRIVINPWILSFVFYLCSILVCSFISQTGVFVPTSLLVFTLMLVNTQIVQIHEHRSILFKNAIFLALVTFAIVYLIKYLPNIVSMDFYRLGSDFGDLNEVSLYFALGFALSIAGVLKHRIAYISLAYLLLSLLFLSCGFFTGSKGFILSTGILLLFGVFLFFGKRRAHISFALIFILAIAFFGLMQLDIFSTLSDRLMTFLTSIFTGGSDQSSNDRFKMFVDGGILFLRSPIFGFGNRGYHLFSSSGGGGWSHNQFTETLVQYGVVGGVLYFAPFISCLISFFKIKSSSVKLKAFDSLFVLLFLMSYFSSLSFDTLKIFAFAAPLVFADCTWNRSAVSNYCITLLGNLRKQ